MEDFRHIGYWWLPDKQDHSKPGTLSFSNADGFELELLGSFEDDLLQSVSGGFVKGLGLQEYPLVLGTTRNGKRVSLFDCMPLGTTRRIPGFASERLSPTYGLIEDVSMPWAAPMPSMFQTMALQFSYLPDWLGFSGIQESYFFESESGSFDKHQIVFQTPEKIEVDIEGARLTITHGYNKQGDNVRGIHLKPIISITIKVEQALSLNDWNKQYKAPLQDFFTFATSRANSVVALTLYSQENGIHHPSGKFYETPIQVYYRQSLKEAKENKTVSSHDMLFGFQDVRDNFANILARWLETHRSIESSINLFLGIDYASQMYLQHEFLNIVQALEVYHRQRFNNEIIPKVHHKKRKKAILEAVSVEHQDWLNEQLGHSNEPRLRHRISELAEHTKEITLSLTENIGCFDKKVVHTRNYLTHYSKRSKHVIEDEKLFWLSQTLVYIMRVCLLLELGFSAERCAAFFKRNQRFLFATRQIKRLYATE